MALVVAAGCGANSGSGHDDGKKKRPTAEERRAAISRANVWAPTKVEEMDLGAGPQGKGAFAPMAAVTCKYVERKSAGGRSPKFDCELPSGDVVKVKYGEDNGEIYGVVAAGRLLWALGFGADRWYPVTLTCQGCPPNPTAGGKPVDGESSLPFAAIEQKFPGKNIETFEDEGWNWSELALVSPKVGGAPRDHIDALALLAAMIQHTDNKAPQQRIVCPPGQPEAPCERPFMFLHDVGLTFGRATFVNHNDLSGANLQEWTQAPIWQDATRCVARLQQSFTGSLGDPVISESGRRFLSDLLARLSDKQVRDLFEVARFPQRSGTTVDQWIAVFNSKREAIRLAACPS